jgi:SAM-dependent methyltransferase
MSHRAARAIREWRGAVESHRAEGESLPFPDASFDSVAMTLTLCSVKDTTAVLSEIRRVLVAGGTYHFFEHVASSEPRALKWQRRLNGVNSALGGGCQLTRDAEGAILGAGFTFERIERALLPGGGMTPRWLFPGIWGKAVRAD